MQVSGVNSEVATATHEFHCSPTTSTCLIAIACLSITHSYCLKVFQYMSHVIHLSQILEA